MLVSAVFTRLDCELKKGKAWIMTDASARRAEPPGILGGVGAGPSQPWLLPDLQGAFRQGRLIDCAYLKHA